MAARCPLTLDGIGGEFPPIESLSTIRSSYGDREMWFEVLLGVLAVSAAFVVIVAVILFLVACAMRIQEGTWPNVRANLRRKPIQQ
jgi:hypothetical protein